MNSIKKNFIYNSLYQILLLIVPLITTPYLSRVLGAGGIGRYSYAFSISYYFAMFILLGLNKYGNRKIATVRDDKKVLSKTFFSIYFMQLFLGIIVFILYLFYCFFISKDLIISLILSSYIISEIFDINWFFFGLEKFKLTVTRNAMIKIFTTLLIFILVKDINDLNIYIMIVCSGFVMTQFILWLFLFNEVNFVKPTIKEILSHVIPNLTFFIPVIAVSLYKTMDKIMLGNMVGVIEVGYYEQVEKIMNIPLALITALGTVMLPRISNMIGSGQTKEINKYFENSLIFSIFISSSMCMGIMTISKELVPIFFGNGFEKCIYLFIILMPSCLFLAFSNVVVNQYMIPNTRDREYIISVMSGAVVNIVINVLLIPYLKSYGAAIGTLFAEAAVCILQIILLQNEINLKQNVINGIPFTLSGFVMFIIVYPVNFKVNIIVQLLLKIIMGIIIYFVTLIVIMFLFRKKVSICLKK